MAPSATPPAAIPAKKEAAQTPPEPVALLRHQHKEALAPSAVPAAVTTPAPVETTPAAAAPEAPTPAAQSTTAGESTRPQPTRPRLSSPMCINRATACALNSSLLRRPAAVFHRADTLWLVFDSAAPIDLAALKTTTKLAYARQNSTTPTMAAIVHQARTAADEQL